MVEAKNLPVKWSVPAVWSVPDKFTVPFPYSIPTDYSVPDIFEEVTTPTQTTTKEQPQKEKQFTIDPLTATLITAGMVGLFGGVAIGRISRKREVKIKDGI